MSFINQQVISAVKLGSGGGGGSGAPALPTLTSTGQTLAFRLYSDTPTGHLYQDDALTSQAAAGNNVMGIKDISGASYNFADTQAPGGAVLTAAAMNAKKALYFNGSTAIIESDNSTNANLVRTATNVAMLIVFQVVGSGAQPFLAMASVKSRGGTQDCLAVRVGGGGGSTVLAGRWGVNTVANNPLVLFSSIVNSGWGDFYGKTFKLLLRAATGTGAVQRLDCVISDGTTAVPVSTTYTNNATDDVDGTSTLWDYFTLGGVYFSNGAYSGNVGYVAEAAMWRGTSQMNSTDTTALLSYATGTAGF